MKYDKEGDLRAEIREGFRQLMRSVPHVVQEFTLPPQGRGILVNFK